MAVECDVLGGEDNPLAFPDRVPALKFQVYEIRPNFSFVL